MSNPPEKANPLKGEAELKIDGETHVIKMHLEAQARIVETLSIEQIEEIPDLLRKMDPETVAKMIACTIVDRGWLLAMAGDGLPAWEWLMTAHMPVGIAVHALISACNLAFWGHEKGDPTEASGKEESDEETETAA